MTWDDIEEIIFDGSQEDIRSLACPSCGSSIIISYTEQTASLMHKCKGCGLISRYNNVAYTPNAVIYFGNNFTTQPKQVRVP